MPVNVFRLVESLVGERVEQGITPTAAQTVFTLTFTPRTPSDVDFYLNAIKYEYLVDFTVSGTTLTWINPLVLDTSDRVEIIYYHTL